MRPPHYAGENATAPLAPGVVPTSFNEAPALRGGKRVVGDVAVRLDQEASMRPPHYAGENLTALSALIPNVTLASMRPPHYAGENLVASGLPDAAIMLQ